MAVNIHHTGCTFTVWAPEKASMLLHLVEDDRLIPMQKDEKEYFSVTVEGVGQGDTYYYQPEGGKDCPDPASHYQPLGIHGPSEVVDHDKYVWQDGAWKGLPLEEMIFYEVHAGTFTEEGTLSAAIRRLDDLVSIGINAIELMPVCQFPGTRNWGYDGVFLYSVQNNYGGPDALKQLVDACHQRGIAVFLDVVYNHVGEEGNYLSFFGPYFSDKYHTPWGKAFNYDGAWSDGVRAFIIDNVLHWAEHYHIDGLRLDAVHEIFDRNAVRIWDQLQDEVRKWGERSGRRLYLVAESDLNSPRVVAPVELGGHGFDAQWLDDFHHALYILLNPSDQQRYYDFGTMEQLVKAYNDGFVHSGEWVKFRKRKHGASSANVPGNKFVVFNQNHDQVGNRADGKRLCMLVDFERVKLASAAILLAPYIPMLFMGEEYADQSPFYYFVSHSDKDLIKAVQEGRRKEFEAFGFDENIPDPQDEKTFLKSKIDWSRRTESRHNSILKWHRELIRLRKEFSALKDFQKRNIEAKAISEKAFVLFRYTAGREEKLMCFFNFSDAEISYNFNFENKASKILDSKDKQWLVSATNEKAHVISVEKGQTITLQPASIVVYTLL